jgi:cell division septation protein DedD
MFKPYGVKLEFTPIVNDDGTIRLKVAPEVSALDFSNAVTVSGTTIPALSSRKAETEVELRSNQSFAISGLLDQRTTDLLSKTPGASSIPIIGALFKSKNINHSTTELVVVITPTLVDPLTDGTAEPAEPGMPIPTLNTETFDKSLGKRLNPNPVVPPMNASPASAINQATPPAVPSSAPVTPPAGAAEDITPAQPAPSVPAAAPVNPPVVYPAATASVVEPAQPQVSTPKAPPAQPSVPVKVTASSVPPPSIFPFAVPQRYVFDNPAAVPAPSTPPAEHVDVPAPTPAMVQIMALSHKEDADAMVAALKRHGYDVSISQDSRDSLLHLEVGPFKNKSDAEAVRHKLMTDGYNATIQ